MVAIISGSGTKNLRVVVSVVRAYDAPAALKPVPELYFEPGPESGIKTEPETETEPGPGSGIGPDVEQLLMPEPETEIQEIPEIPEIKESI